MDGICILPLNWLASCIGACWTKLMYRTRGSHVLLTRLLTDGSFCNSEAGAVEVGCMAFATGLSASIPPGRTKSFCFRVSKSALLTEYSNWSFSFQPSHLSIAACILSRRPSVFMYSAIFECMRGLIWVKKSWGIWEFLPLLCHGLYLI